MDISSSINREAMRLRNMMATVMTGHKKLLILFALTDGYTLFMHNSSHLGTLQAIYKQFKHQPGDYTAISRWTTAPLLLAVSVGSGIQNVPELIKRAKAAPGKLNYASSGVGGGTHLPGLLFTKAAGVDIVHVPYKGGAPALQGVDCLHPSCKGFLMQARLFCEIPI
jgi:tripartite-type tricarboxylate transporter receptor subunit TctC